MDDDEALPCRVALEESLDAFDLLEYVRTRPSPRFSVEVLRDDDDHGCPVWGLHVEVAGALVRIDPGERGRPDLTVSADLVTAVDPCSFKEVLATPVARQLLDRGWQTAIGDDDFGGPILFWRSVRRSQSDDELTFISKLVRAHDERVTEAMRALGHA